MPSADPAGLRHDELQRRGPAGAWRPLAGIPLLLVIFFAGQLVLSLVVTLVLVAGGDSSTEAVDKLSGEVTTPSFLALVNLGWAAAIPRCGWSPGCSTGRHRAGSPP